MNTEKTAEEILIDVFAREAIKLAEEIGYLRSELRELQKSYDELAEIERTHKTMNGLLREENEALIEKLNSLKTDGKTL